MRKSRTVIAGLMALGCVSAVASSWTGAGASRMAAPPAAASTQVASEGSGRIAWAQDVDGNVHRFDGRKFAVVLLGVDCPIARKSVETLNALAKRSAEGGVEFYGLLSDPTVSRAAAATFAKEYGAGFPILFDASGEIARALSPRVTPEAFVFDVLGRLEYRGRIDDTYVALGKRRTETTTHELADAIDAVAAGNDPTVREAAAVGCVYEAWKPVGSAAGAVTYNRDVAPILAANCVSCHKQGQVAPFTLTSYADASKRAELLAQVTETRYMPPWRAAEQAHRFADERRLSDAEISVMKRWAEAGAPEGSASDAPAVTTLGASPWRLGTPDLVVEMPKAFDVPASGKDVYRAFALPVPLEKDQYVTAFEFQAGAPSVVHHALLFLDGSGEAKRREGLSTDGEPGYTSFGGPGFVPVGGLGGWAPGASPAFLPEGIGRPLQKGWDVVLQVHYHPDGQSRSDRSRVGLYFAKKPISRVALNFPLNNRQIDIPAGDEHYVRTMTMTLPRNAELIGITPHMHLIGQSMKVTATLPTGEVEQLIDVPQWDFRWQDQYRYAEPLTLPAGTRIDAEAVYDNSEHNAQNPNMPPKRVVRGEQTTDEMCLVFLQVVVDKQTWETMRSLRGGANGAGGLLRRLRGGE